MLSGAGIPKNLLEQMEAIRKVVQQFQAAIEIINRAQIPFTKDMQVAAEIIELQRKHFEEITKTVLPRINLGIIQAQPILKSVKEFRKNYEKLVEPFMLLQKTAGAKPINLPKIETFRFQATATTNALLACINALEVELAKEKEKNKKLLEMIEKMKGKMEKERPSYIA